MPKISALPAGTAVTGAELFPAVQGGITVYLTLNQVRTYFGNVRVITAAGNVVVADGDGLIIMNKTVSQITSISLPLSTTKIGGVKIVDWKNDSDAFPITVTRSGADTFNGSQTTWTISAQGASAVFDPVSGLGYAV